MLKDDDAKDKLMAEIFKALAHEYRIKMLRIIMNSEKPLHIKALTEMLNADYPIVYKHIKILEKAGIIGIFMVGRSRVPYVKRKEELSKLLEDLVNIVKQ
ncbi:MAG: ArsR/SmtB family transcription factor [Nitrososphaeria archaeon]|nr:winged helix-turn-helix domain-containing protein [Conexivisphaerales archaeon]